LWVAGGAVKDLGSSLPMIGDWDTGRQPTVALREPMAYRAMRERR
jgi:hypothetical protein